METTDQPDLVKNLLCGVFFFILNLSFLDNIVKKKEQESPVPVKKFYDGMSLKEMLACYRISTKEALRREESLMKANVAAVMKSMDEEKKTFNAELAAMMKSMDEERKTLKANRATQSAGDSILVLMKSMDEEKKKKQITSQANVFFASTQNALELLRSGMARMLKLKDFGLTSSMMMRRLTLVKNIQNALEEDSILLYLDVLMETKDDNRGDSWERAKVAIVEHVQEVSALGDTEVHEMFAPQVRDSWERAREAMNAFLRERVRARDAKLLQKKTELETDEAGNPASAPMLTNSCEGVSERVKVAIADLVQGKKASGDIYLFAAK